jgi:RNA polymerase sigma-70 factor, ECF subfamily
LSVITLSPSRLEDPTANSRSGFIGKTGRPRRRLILFFVIAHEHARWQSSGPRHMPAHLVCDAFIAALPAGIGAHEDLERALAALVARGRAAWPGFLVDDASFAAHVAARWTDAVVTPAALDAGEAADLYLACACTRGERAALTAFDATHRKLIRDAVRRINARPQVVDDATHLVIDRLLVAAPGEPPRIAQDTGRSPLAAFVRVVAVRIALDVVRSERADRIGDDALADIGDDRDDPELQYLKQLYKDQFRVAFAAALSRLSARERALLRYQVVDDLSVDQIAALLGRPRSTVGRHLVEARNELIAETRAELRRQLRIERNELSSVLRLVQSSVDVSVRRLLGEGPAEASP